MKILKTIRVGSGAFFSNYPDYVVHDIDELNIVDDIDFSSHPALRMRDGDKDVIFYKKRTKEEVIEACRKFPLSVGKILVPEYVKTIGLTIDELKELKDIFDRLDPKHHYEKVIWEYYIENGGFYLTDEQRQVAYNDYKKSRGL